MEESGEYYLISVLIEGERRYVRNFRHTVICRETARRFRDRNTARKYLRKYGFDGISPSIEKISDDRNGAENENSRDNL